MTLYRCIVADPPWNERGGGKIKRGADRHYPLMRAPEIASAMLDAPVWTPAPRCHLWLWATTNHLREALGVMEAVGFRYVTHVVWVKMDETLQVGLGQYIRHAHELCLLGVRGSDSRPGPENRPPSVLFAPRGRHSAKPDSAFAIFETVSGAPRVEMFARTRRKGWQAWGNEV